MWASGSLILASPGLPETAHPGRDLRLCRLECQPASLKVPDAPQDQLGLVPMELPDLQGDDATLTICEDTEGEDGLHTKGGSRLESLALADQQRIVNRTLRSVFLYRFPRIDGDTHNFQAISGMFATKSLEERNLAATRVAPGGPKIDYERPAFPVRQATNLAIDSRQP
jgi:hypothetical protein